MSHHDDEVKGETAQDFFPEVFSYRNGVSAHSASGQTSWQWEQKPSLDGPHPLDDLLGDLYAVLWEGLTVSPDVSLTDWGGGSYLSPVIEGLHPCR